MEFENIETDEFYYYKQGFVNGKNDILNKIIANISYEEFSDYSDWISLGYEDGYSFYLEYYLANNNIPLEFIVGTVSWEIIKDCFLERVIQHNEQTNNKKIPLFKVKVRSIHNL